MTLKIAGLKGLTARLNGLAKSAPREAAAALYQEGLALQALAVSKTPVDTGRLRASAGVSPPERRGNVVEVFVYFGTNYAVYVHERLDVHHPVGEAKFLENAARERAPGFRDRMADRIRANLESGTAVDPLAG